MDKMKIPGPAPKAKKDATNLPNGGGGGTFERPVAHKEPHGQRGGSPVQTPVGKEPTITKGGEPPKPGKIRTFS